MWYIIGGLSAALVVFFVLALRMGHAPGQVARMALRGAREALPVLVVLVCIGMVTGIWRAAGTIIVFVSYGVWLITPRLFLLVAFLLTSLLSYALGTSFGVAGTVGVIFMTLARSGGVDPILTGGVVLSGVFFGDRGSPVSSTATMVSRLTDTDLYGNVRRMAKSGAVPFLLCVAVYAVLSIRHPIQTMDDSVTRALASAFSFTPWAFLPAVVLLVLPLFRVPILLCMGLSVATGALVARFGQGADWNSILRSCVLGYQAQGDGLAAILDGGGIRSMLDSCVIITLACGCSGIFNETDMLRTLHTRVSRLSARLGTVPVMILISLAASAIFCNQVIAIVMSSVLLGPVYAAAGRTKEALALDMENVCITVPAFVPWSIICSVPLRLLGVDYRSMGFAVLLYAVPLAQLFRERCLHKRNRMTIH